MISRTFFKPQAMTTVIIVLNWQNAIKTVACLDSLKSIMASDVAVIVIDNGSGDDSVSFIRQRHPNLTLLETGANLGYAGGNNVGIRWALERGAEFIGILNNDVTIEPGFLEPLVATLRAHPDVGVATPLVAEQVDGGRVWALGSAVNWRTAAVSRQHANESIKDWRHRSPFEVEIASGAAMLAKQEVFERAGLLDEKFFLYFEEVDWCMKVGQAGYRILAAPSSVVWHEVSGTLGTTSPVIDYYMLRNHLRLIGRHWSGARRDYLWSRVVLCNLMTIAAYTVKPHGGRRIPNRNARLLALLDASLGHWGKMGADVAKICYPSR